MRVDGGGSIQVWETKDERPHAPGLDASWQESVVMVWWDLKQGIGGYYRIGHEINYERGPHVVLWSCTFTPEGIFRNSSFLPLRDQDRFAQGFGSGDGSLRFEFDDHAIWTLKDHDIAGELHVRDFHAGIDGYPKNGDIAKVAPAHLEVAGKVEGKLTVKGKRFEIDGLAFRDHGWGNRAWNMLLSHRWLAGTFGPDLSFIAISFHSAADQIEKFGWVVKGDTVIFAKTLDILAYVEIDSITTCGGRLRMELNDGDTLDIAFEALAPGAVFFHHNIACVDTMCRITTGNRVGMADFETTQNPQQGTRRPKTLYNGVIENGWHSVGR